MSDAPIFPDLHGKVMPVRAAVLMTRANPKVLDHPACPYDTATKDFLKTFVPTDLAQAPAVHLADLNDFDGVELVEEQLLSSINAMRSFAPEMAGKPMDEKIQYHKTISGLLEKFTSLREKLAGVKEAGEFTKVVMDIVQDIMTAEQRTLVMERLEPYVRTATKTNQ